MIESPRLKSSKKCLMYSEVRFEGEGEPIPLPPRGMVKDIFQECSLTEPTHGAKSNKTDIPSMETSIISDTYKTFKRSNRKPSRRIFEC